MIDSLLIFGCRSPLVVDIEETIGRLGVARFAAVSLGGAPRVLDQSKVVSIEDLVADPALSNSLPPKYITCAFSTSRRMALVDSATVLNLSASEPLIDPTAIVSRSSRIGLGTFINCRVAFGGACFVGEHVLVNRSASIGHHCVIEDFVSVAPGVTVASNVRIGKGATLGAGATVVPNVSVGENAVVGAGSVVLKDVPDNGFVVGNPAKERVLNRTSSSINTDGEE